MILSRLYLVVLFVCYPISAIFAFSFPENGPTYYQINLTHPDFARILLNTLLIFFTAVVGVRIGCIIGDRIFKGGAASETYLYKFKQSKIVKYYNIFLLFIICSSVIGPLILLFEYGLLNNHRIIQVTSGMGRYNLLLSIFNSAVSLLACSLFWKYRVNKNHWLLVVLTFLVLFFANSWSGGRSVAVIYTLPVVYLVMLSDRSKIANRVWLTIIATIVLLIALGISESRSRVYTENPFDSGIVSILKWEFGRAPMLHYLLERIETNSMAENVGMLTSFEQFLPFTFEDNISVNEYFHLLIFGTFDFVFIAVGGFIELLFMFGSWGYVFILALSTIVAIVEKKIHLRPIGKEILIFILAIIIWRFSFVGIQSSIHYVFYYLFTYSLARIPARIILSFFGKRH